MVKVDIGDVYIQYIRIDVKRTNPEYIVINEINNGNLEFTFYYKWDGHLMECEAEGHIDQLLEGLKKGDIVKSNESDLHSFICLCKLLEA